MRDALAAFIQFLLSTLSHIFKLDSKYFVKSTFYTSLQQLIGIVCGLAVNFLFGHFVSKNSFGEYNLVLSIVALFTFLSLPGMDGALSQSVGRGYDHSLFTSISRKIRFSFLGSLTLAGVAVYYLLNNQSGLAFSLGITAVFFPLLNTPSIFTSFLTVKKLFKTLALLSIVSSVIFLVLNAISILSFPTTVTLTFAYVIGVGFSAFLGYYLCRTYISRKKSLDPDLTNYGTFLTFLSVLPWIASYLGNIVVGSYLGTLALATFSVGYSFLSSVQKNITVFYKPVTAKLATSSAQAHNDVLKTHGLKFLLLGALLTLIVWIFTPAYIHFFFPTYPEAITYGRWLSFLLLPMPINWILEDILLYQKRKREQLVISVSTKIAKIIAYFLAIPTWHIQGLIGVFLLDRYLTPLLLWFSFRRTLK